MAVAEIFVTLGNVARRVDHGLHSPRHRHVPTSKADSSGSTMRVTSASVAAVVTRSVLGGRLFSEPTEARAR